MAYSSENSCKKGCSCDSCKGSHKSIKSEAFKQKAADLVNKTRDALRHGAEVVIRNQLHTPDNFTTPAAMAAPFVVGGAAAVDKFTNNAISHTAKKAANTVINTARKLAPLATAVAENSNYIGSPQHYNDLVDRHKKDLENINKRKSEGPLVFQHLQMIAQKSLENVQNHPLHPKNEQKAEDMLRESHFKPGQYLQHDSKGLIQGVKPYVPHKVVGVESESVGSFGDVVTYHLKDPTTGKVHKVVNAHILFRKVNPNPIRDQAIAKASKMSEELKTVDDVTKTLPRGVEKKGPGEAYGDVEKCAPAPKDKDKTVVAGKTGEEYSKKPQTEVKKMSEDKYARLAEAAFGSLNRSNPFRSSPVDIVEDNFNEEETKLTNREWKKDSAAVKNSKDPEFVNKMIDKWGERGSAWLNHPALNVKKEVKEDLGLKAFKQNYDPKTSSTVPGFIKNAAKAVGAAAASGLHNLGAASLNTVSKLTGRGPVVNRSIEEDNINHRFPDVERDIAAIMKESYKKKKMQEEAANMYIATAEQREDWLNVGRGSMDVLDYINKYKV